MKIQRFIAVWLLICWATPGWAADLDERTMSFGRFGAVHLYQGSGGHPDQVVLFVSGDGGWNLGVVDMARALAGLGALVVGIDMIRFLKTLGASSEPCAYPAADFESLSKYIQKELGYPDYRQPILVGYSSGATLIYAVLVQAPANTFKAAISLGFCADLPLVNAPCKGGGLTWTKDPRKNVYNFLPFRQLGTPWVVFQGDVDQVCPAGKTRAYIEQIPEAQLIMLPKVGHGYSVPKNWLPQFKQVFRQLTAPAARSAAAEKLDLPLVEVPAEKPGSRLMAVLVTGDGGWAGLDQQVARQLAAQGICVVGLSSLKYFWTPRTPDSAAQDLARILEHYLAAWHKEKTLLIGYSLGADVLPFMAARLSSDLREHISQMALLAPGRQTAFEFHLSDWVGGGQARQYPIRPEIDKLAALPILCFHGEEENDSLCRDRLPPNVTVIPMAGAHHLGGSYQAIVEKILAAAK